MLTCALDQLQPTLSTLLISKRIPWIVQAQLAREGYVSLEDLADRWDTPEIARRDAPRDLGFQNGENGFDQRPSTHSAIADNLRKHTQEFTTHQDQDWSTRSDSLLKRQFRFISKGEIGYIQFKHIIGALPEEGERPIKTNKRITVDGWEKEDPQLKDDPWQGEVSQW